MAELARKRRVRAGQRASVTRILGLIEPCLAAVPVDVSKITQYKRSLEGKLQALTTLDEDILGLTDEDAIEAEIVQADETKEGIYQALSQLELALGPQAPRTPPHTPPTPPADAPTDDPPGGEEPGEPHRDTTGEDRSSMGGAKIRLPKITLPRFAGDPIRWMSFWDTYQSHVRSLKSLGIEASSYGALLSPVLLAKLPPELRLIVSRKVSDTDLNMDDLHTTFEEELTARERAIHDFLHPIVGITRHQG